MNFTRTRITLAVLALMIAGLFAATHSVAAPMANLPTPVNPAAQLQSAQHQFTVGNYSAAIATLHSVVSQDATNATAFYWLSRCYYEIRDVDQAISQAEKSVALEPLNSVYEDWLGRAYGQKAQRDKSYFAARKVKKHFERAVELDPANISARRDLAEFCARAPRVVGGDSGEALGQIDAIAKIDPIAGHLARASFDVTALNRADLADAEYKQILAAHPKDAQPYFDAVAFYQQQNQPAEMDAFLDAAARLGQNDPRLTFYRAEAMTMFGTELDRAADYIKSYLASTPDRSDWPSHAAAREWLGRVYEMQGRRMQAAEQYRASLQLDPGRTTAQARLERLEKDSL